jgi:queuosine biosynthesis protein QueC
MKTLVLLSGGMDSVTALHWARSEHEVAGAVSFDYGSKHNPKELPYAKWHCDQLGIPHDVISLDFINRLFTSDLLQSGGEVPEGHYADENMKKTVVPFRNGIMLAIACGIAESRGAEGLVIAAHAGDHAIYPDCREGFMQGMATAMREGTYACAPSFTWTRLASPGSVPRWAWITRKRGLATKATTFTAGSAAPVWSASRLLPSRAWPTQRFTRHKAS